MDLGNCNICRMKLEIAYLAILVAVAGFAQAANYCKLGECYSCGIVGGGADKSCLYCGHGISEPVPGSTNNAKQCNVSNIPENCLIINGTYCDKCKEGFYIAETNGPCIAVTAKITNCREYYQNQTCRLCDLNYYPSNDKA